MSRKFSASLEREIARIYLRSCEERELEVAELLLQALDLLARRDGDESTLDAAILESLAALTARDTH